MFGLGSDMPTEGTSEQMISLQGHPGHLNESQEKALEAFKVELEESELYIPQQGDRPATYDDTLLLRYLRARRFDPIKAQKLLADRCAWEQQNDVLNLFANFPTDEFENARKYYPRWTGRRDRYGRPLYVYKLATTATALQGELAEVPSERRYQRIIALYEVMTRFVGPLCTILPHPPHNTPIASVTTIIDLAGVSSLRQLWNLRSHLQQASELANANYPETLGAVAVVNAPPLFSTVWGWVKGWYDPATRDKIRVLGHVGGESQKDANANRALQELVDRSNLPKEYGGDMEWSFYDEPNLDDDAKKEIGAESLPKGPWIFDLLDRKVKRPAEYQGQDTVWPPTEAAPVSSLTIHRSSDATIVAPPDTEPIMKQITGEQGQYEQVPNVQLESAA